MFPGGNKSLSQILLSEVNSLITHRQTSREIPTAVSLTVINLTAGSPEVDIRRSRILDTVPHRHNLPTAILNPDTVLNRWAQQRREVYGGSEHWLTCLTPSFL
jgi:hypothetical protein